MVVWYKIVNLVFYGWECFSVWYVINCYAALWISIVTMSNTPEPLLTCSIPHLQFYYLIINLHSLYFKIYSNCAHIAISEGIVSKSEQHGSFSWVALAYEHYFKKSLEIIRLKVLWVFDYSVIYYLFLQITRYYWVVVVAEYALRWFQAIVLLSLGKHVIITFHFSILEN
jgi:hypothetical protein